jgi:hypothetical protein
MSQTIIIEVGRTKGVAVPVLGSRLRLMEEIQTSQSGER